MAFVKVKIVNCKKASIRRHPWIPLLTKDVVDIKDGVDDNTNIVSIGSTIEIDPTEVCYDWTDRKFYRVKNPKGWIYEGCVDYGGGDGG